VKETDFVLAKVPKPSILFAQNNIEYNQNEVSKVSCPIHSSITALSSLTGYRFTLEERKELWQKALALGANPNVGWNLSSAIDLVRKYWNGKQKQQVLSFRVTRCINCFLRIQI
jgi:hypothetical protein